MTIMDVYCTMVVLTLFFAAVMGSSVTSIIVRSVYLWDYIAIGDHKLSLCVFRIPKCFHF
jgi:hypothetical protein